MRKYYSTRTTEDTLLVAHARKISDRPWVLFKALLQGFPATWRPKIKQALLTITENRDVMGLVGIQNELDACTLMYTRATHPSTVVLDRRALAFLRKYPFTSKDCAAVKPRDTAIEKWRAAELQCQLTNERLTDESLILPTWVKTAQQLIADCLPQVDSNTIKNIFERGNHGPGATQSNSATSGRVTAYYKFADLPYTCTLEAQRYALAAISKVPRWINHLESSGLRKNIPLPGTPRYQQEMQIFCDCVDIENADKITFVPKSILTDRPIAISSSLNMFLQLGVKSVLERALRKVGVDLRNQTRNQELAYLGSKFAFNKDGSVNMDQYSTIDLSSASDTVSIEIVRLLLPPEWFAILSDLRHKVGVLNGETVVYNKFSAMGNGYTFPLESLIFWAIAKASILEDQESCTYDDISIYGDDIIVRFKNSNTVVQNLIWAGFQINHEKSFFQGEFKESCGADYFRGTDVRPLYLKKEIITDEDIYYICNKTQDKCRSQLDYDGYSAVFSCALGFIPKRSRIFIPLSLKNDSGLMVPLSYMRKIGMNPYLSFTEWCNFFRKNVKSTTPYEYSQGSCYYVSRTKTPCSYTGRLNLRILSADRKSVV